MTVQQLPRTKPAQATGLAAAAFVYGTAALIAAADVAKTPLMVSFADLKWTALPDGPGMQSAALSGYPAVGPKAAEQ
jgi:hypothetical protein